MNTNVNLLTKLSALLLAAGVATGCSTEKSESPLSPNVAGPIAGVGISSPSLLSPVNGLEVTNSQPVRLTWEPSSTNGQRSLWYSVEVAADREFQQRVYFNPKIPAVDGIQSVVVDAKLDAERTYYWRARAEDGANASDFSHVAFFDLVIPVVLGPPTALSPAGGQTVSGMNPTLSVRNGTNQGRARDVAYVFRVSGNQAFSSLVWEGAVAQHPSGTTTVISGTLAPNTVYYWQSYATNGTVTGAMSETQSFRSPAAPSPGGGGGGGGLPPAPGGVFRTPDPPAGQMLPLPGYGASVVQQVAAQFPNALRNSCQEHGGSWEFMDRVVDALRQYDTRWGYNWKRGNIGDPSQDVVDYHWGRGASENSTEVYIIDVIGGHCGGSPSPGWGDVTEATRQGGSIGRWTGRGRFSG